jgi:hypothetical protein
MSAWPDSGTRIAPVARGSPRERARQGFASCRTWIRFRPRPPCPSGELSRAPLFRPRADTPVQGHLAVLDRALDVGRVDVAVVGEPVAHVLEDARVGAAVVLRPLAAMNSRARSETGACGSPRLVRRPQAPVFEPRPAGDTGPAEAAARIASAVGSRVDRESRLTLERRVAGEPPPAVVVTPALRPQPFPGSTSSRRGSSRPTAHGFAITVPVVVADATTRATR